MFRSVNEKSKPGAQPVSGDERVRKEEQFEEDLRSSGSAGNEDANVKFMEMLLDPGNKYGPREGRRGPIEQKEELLIDQIDGKFYGGNESFGNISFSSGKKAENDGFSFNDLIIPGPENGAGGAGDISSSEGKKPQKEDIKAAIEIAEDLHSGEDQKSVGSIDSNDPNFRIMEVLLDPANKYGPEDRHGPIEEKEEPLIDLLAGQFAGGNENFGDMLPGPGEKEEKEEPKGSGNIMNDVPAKKPRRKNDEFLPLSTLSDRINGKQRDFLMIVRGLYRSLKTNDPNQQVSETEIFNELGKVVMEAVVNRQFAVSGGDLKVAGGYISLAAGAMQIVKKKNSEFYKQLKTMIRVCQMEDKDKTLTRINRPA